MIKLIASDLDGTILLNGAQELPEELFDIIRKLKEKGIFFVAASGRQYANMKRNFAPVKNEIGFVCENGTLAYWKDKLLYEVCFEREVADALVRDIVSREKSDYLYSTREFYYIKPKTEEYLHLLRDVIRNDFKVVDSFDKMTLPCIKMACYEPDGVTEEDRLYWHEHYDEICNVMTAGHTWVDFIPFGANKAKGVKAFMELLHVKPEECMTFGDEFNDIAMLQCVPYGFAMAHAKEGVKEKAPYIVENALDTLKRLLEADGNIEEVLKYVQ